MSAPHMSASPQSDNDLRELLQTWKLDSRDDPALARRVWARLAAEKPGALSAWVENLSRLFARPAVALTALALFAVIGGLVAAVQNSSRHEARVMRLATEYAQSIDPILMTHPVGMPGKTP
jgi:hypothetical protein